MSPKKLTSRIVLGDGTLGCSIPKEMNRISKSGEVLNFSANHDGWIAREQGTDDPADSTSIDNTRTARDADNSNLDPLSACLAQLDDVHRQIQKAVDDYNNRIPKARPNKSGSTHTANGKQALSKRRDGSPMVIYHDEQRGNRFVK